MRLVLTAWLFFYSALAGAAGLDMLRIFLQQTTTGKARFAQIIVDKNMKQLQQATGTMHFARPGKFRWEYEKPYEQLIVGDGSRLWVYDKDLNQVSVRKLDQALGDSPAALLAGSNEIEKIYNLTNLGNQEGLDWVEAVPKSKENAFERIRLGFSESGLQAMELRDQFGQATVIKFAEVERNPKLSPELFKFVPPKGADVIRE
ncbi:MAG: outer membrane lipoprotein chaperone LolA [Betaproteobacteria bacterium]|nr:outer membrane lipoprotein chaperone LolA [Betaproteobacteria bacterium]MBI2290449.1 outer membrane lipoprotein chaperone LolA [Betaproteobacteria bacterium]